MKITQKQYEVKCNEYRTRWKKFWDQYLLVGDAWLSGYRTAREEAYDLVFHSWNNDKYSGLEVATGIKTVAEDVSRIGEDPVEVEIDSQSPGHHNVTTKENFKEEMKRFYNCEDLRVHVSEDGVFSFQGTFRSK